MNKKSVNTLIVSTVICLFSLAIMLESIFINSDNSSKFEIIIGTLVLLVFILGIIYFTKQRVDEIEGGEEDDISKY